jgi:hypothetical protein
MKKIVLSTISLILIILYNIKGVYFGVLGVSFIFLLCYLITFFTITFYFSKDFFGSCFYFWKNENEKQNIVTLCYSLLIMIFIGSLLFPLNDSKELGNQIIWGCYIEASVALIGVIWVMGLILSFILLIIGLINPIKIRFKSRQKLFYSLFIINSISLLIIYIMYKSINLLSSNLHGASSSCL